MWCGFQCTDQLRYVDAGLILFSLKCHGYELSLPMNICSCILCNPCSCLQIVAGIVNYTFLVVIYILEVACILMYLFTWISKFTSILLLYIVMYPDTSRMIFCWWSMQWREPFPNARICIDIGMYVLLEKYRPHAGPTVGMILSRRWLGYDGMKAGVIRARQISKRDWLPQAKFVQTLYICLLHPSRRWGNFIQR